MVHGHRGLRFESTLKLSQYITTSKPQILAEWEAFARTLLPAADGMTDLALRDHAAQILDCAVKDITTPQSEQQQKRKSEGDGPGDDGKSAATIHGELRHLDGFSLNQLLSEYRALRAAVLRLWEREARESGDYDSYGMLRFNEFIDQAVAESAASFSDQHSTARELFLAILGHDLRGPLATMLLSGEILVRDRLTPDAIALCGAQVIRSATTMTAMVNDLLEYSRTQLGARLPVGKQIGDLALVCEASLVDARSGYPNCVFQLSASGDTIGEFDHVRMQQVFTNLLNNAAKFGGSEQPVTLDVVGEASVLRVLVGNHGAPIPREAIKGIFKPLVRLPARGGSQSVTSLGLGLFVAREITEAHHGKLSVESSQEAGTVFTVCIPRR